MQVPQALSPAVQAVNKAIKGVVGFARLERVLAGVCFFVPVLLIWADEGPVRDSISAYHDMTQAQVFYVPLTMAVMLFVVNGVIKQKRFYNTVLGVMLAGVILFNHDAFTIVHGIFAFAFFGGNAIVILAFSSKKERWFKVLLIAAMILSGLAFLLFEPFTLFWAEWVSFAIIALHYILESWGVID